MNEPKRFMRLPDVVALVGLKRTAIYGRIKKGTFPAPVQLGPRAVAWAEADIAEWQAGLKTGVKPSGYEIEDAHSREVSSRSAAVHSCEDLARLNVTIDFLTKEVAKLQRQIEALQKEIKKLMRDRKNAD